MPIFLLGVWKIISVISFRTAKIHVRGKFGLVPHKIERNVKKLEKVAECVSVNKSRIKMYIERLKPGCVRLVLMALARNI